MQLKYINAAILFFLLAIIQCGTMPIHAYDHLIRSSLTPEGLAVEFLNEPVGLDSSAPRFSWTLHSSNSRVHNLRQTAYRILVASSPEALARGDGDVWDSGCVNSPRYVGVRFAGRQLESHTEYFWKVRVWDQDGGASAWSSVASWTTGLMYPSDWKAHWIAAVPDGPVEPKAREHVGVYANVPPPLPIFRKDFEITKPVRFAVVYISGLGQYELHLDGVNVSPDLMVPGWTLYRKRVLYNAYDVTQKLQRGGHSFGVLLGNGMYNVPGIKGRYTKFIASFGQPKLIVQMHIRYTDGTDQVVASDGSWRTTPGPIVLSSIYGGEDYDARRNPSGWDKPAFNDRAWHAAYEVRGPDGEAEPGSELKAETIPPIRVAAILRPVKVSKSQSNASVYDLGQNFAGWPFITVKGHSGDVVRLRPGELLNAEGNVTQASAGGRKGKETLFTYILKGDGIEHWHPRFMYYGFRYVEVECIPGSNSNEVEPKVLALEGASIHSSAHEDGSFSAGLPILNRIHHLIDAAIVSNMMSVLTDCPTREKLGWLEQTHLAATSIMYNYNVANLYNKIVDDMDDSQLDNGLIPSIAPEYVAFVNAKGVSTDFRDSPEWGSAVVLSSWAAYQFYGDASILAEHYDAMRRYVEYLKSKSEGGLLSYGLGDWYDVGPNPPGESQLTAKGVTATAIYYQDLTVMTRIAEVLGKKGDHRYFASEAQAVKEAFNARYFHPDLNQYDRGSQTANAMPLALGMVPPDHRLAVLDRLVQDIRANHNHVSAGDVGFHYVVRALTDGGRSDVLLAALLRTDKPSYGYQLAKGATTLTETWDADPSNSQNHFMLGHAEEWFYRGLAGIDFDMSRPVDRQIIIRPSFLCEVHQASARYESVLGTIVSRWQCTKGSTDLDVQIPAGAKALIVLPTEKGQVILQDRRPLSQPLSSVAGSIQMKIGSGRYHFTIR